MGEAVTVFYARLLGKLKPLECSTIWGMTNPDKVMPASFSGLILNEVSVFCYKKHTKKG